MKNLKLAAALLALSIALASCTGDDGAPGPQGDTGTDGAPGATGATGPAGEGIKKIGYFQGTVTGKQTNGKDFSEAFKFEYGPDTQSFYESAGNKWLTLYRYNAFYYYTSNLEVSSLQFSGNNLIAVPYYTNVSFRFTKEASSTDLFKIDATPYFMNRDSYVVRLSEDQNNTYHFLTGENNIYYNTGVWTMGGTSVSAYIFTEKDYKYEVYYSYTDGALLGYYDLLTNAQVTSGEVFNLYNQITFKNNAALGQLTFYNKGSKASLHAIIPATPADQLTITNYVHDSATGNLSFDYTLKVSKYRSKTGGNYGWNSTGNDLVITGSFNSGGKVYKNIVSRTASGG